MGLIYLFIFKLFQPQLIVEVFFLKYSKISKVSNLPDVTEHQNLVSIQYYFLWPSFSHI